jgi:hypothetical protein
VQANKKVTLPLNSTPYSEAWDKLISDGWTGTYECDFIAEGPGWATAIADAFTITPRATTPSTYMDFQANNCTIPVGKSTCASTLYLTNPQGKMYSVKNMTRGITTSNLLTPNNYTSVPGSNYPTYSVSAHSTGDAANYATNGANDLMLLEGTSNVILKRATMTATCASGSIWNGKVCSPTGWIACTDVVRMCEDGSVMPRDPKSCSFLPEQCPRDPRVPAPLAISCSKPTYSLGEEVSCKISGWVGTKMCWQRGITNTEPKDCTQVWWVADGNELYFYKWVSSSMLGEYALYVKDTLWTISSTKVQYNANQPGLDPAPTYIDFQANNCTIPLGKNKCASSLFVKAPAGKYFTVVNLNRGFTSTNLLNPKTYASIPGSNTLVYTVSESPMGDAANYITYGESNNLNLLENTTVVARAIASAKCADGTTWDGKSCVNSGVVPVPPVACTMEARMCGDGSVMPRDTKSCKWLPERCPPIPEPPVPSPTPAPTPTPPPIPPSDITISVSSIWWVALNWSNSVQFSKSPTSALTAEGKINKTWGTYMVKLSSNTSEFFMEMPVNANGVWSSTNTNTPTMYRSRIVVQGENLLTFTLLDSKTKSPIARTQVKAYVTITRGWIIIDPPICMMADWSKWSCANPPIIPPYPNCPKTSISSTTAGSALVYCPTDNSQEVNPQELNPQNTITPIKPPPTTLPPTRGTGVIVKPEVPTLPPNCGTKSSIGTSNSLIYCPVESEILIKDSITDLAPIEDVLDSNSRRRIDIIIARTKTRIATMGNADGISFIDTSISRIKSIPNKTAKTKLIDTYTIAKLEALKSGLQSTSNNNDGDYIGLIDNLLAR